LLDVGFGCGDAVIYWSQHYKVNHIMGLNIAPHQVKIAQKRVEKLGISNIDLKLGSATDIRSHFPNKQFNKICTMDAAYHFSPSRKHFFQEGISLHFPF
jgi:microcystin synthetase protein McyJ